MGNIITTNMNIVYKDIKDFTEKELEDLFLSVEWSSGHFPDKLIIAMKNSRHGTESIKTCVGRPMKSRFFSSWLKTPDFLTFWLKI